MISTLLAAIAAIIVAVYYWGIRQIPLLGIGDPIGPRFFPGLLCIAMLLCALLLLLEGRKKSAARRPAADSLKPVLAAVAVIALYFLAFEPLGYLLDTLLFLAITMGWCHSKRLPAMLAALLFSVASWYLFKYALNVPLPAGRLFS
ncbi:tripartite tricarboxylate transporter TctB family protein [Brenneria tiliae]|uniref:tripartite tricarboxylate transporter TctB family protein n=1 Tax=Brenneria tiliae TaxID=2914984 RepID=UPI002014B4C8|nr:tripartite tricarboxylate transporter TctB family protein [Brenneria tiliae]MCL2896939.1 tripartite tricarboxylate transporter TctB family protein [Brenneria tiliae]MCL2901497.1 tripartite tricarboxylate transporter TctB family protein [Brenneria tiliae]